MPLLLLSLLIGCRNDCQQLCSEMQAFAQECGLTFNEEQVDACRSENAGSGYKDGTYDGAYSEKEARKEHLDSCKQALPYLREEWTCDDLAPYFQEDPDTGNGVTPTN